METWGILLPLLVLADQLIFVTLILAVLRKINKCLASLGRGFNEEYKVD